MEIEVMAFAWRSLVYVSGGRRLFDRIVRVKLKEKFICVLLVISARLRQSNTNVRLRSFARSSGLGA